MKFFGKEFSDEEVERLCNHLSIENFKNNKSVNYDVMKELGILITGEQSFIRKGKYTISHIMFRFFFKQTLSKLKMQPG